MNAISINSCRQDIRDRMNRCRLGTLTLLDSIEERTFCKQAHPEFSPVGWHLGHIAFTEAYWIIERCAGLAPMFPEYHQLFAANGLPKQERQNLPSIEVVCDYLEQVRSAVFNYLDTAPLEQEERLWRWLLQHESQHSETMALVLQLQCSRMSCQWSVASDQQQPTTDMILIPAGEFEMGNESITALDNERPRHRVYLNDYRIDRYPVTCKQYRAFMEAGGYQNHQWWSSAGWTWLAANPVAQPLYWSNESIWDHHPVCGVSGYEAEAYARFMGKRLPTEAEWEKAASWDADLGRCRTYPWGEVEPTLHHCNHNHQIGHTTPVDAYPQGQSAYGCYDLLGNVWEWTASWFDQYSGFVSYPYPGYSQVYFDGQHRVLKGGSWATRPWAMRSSFRNWYYPGIRQILAGFRCVDEG